jgi:hypothetical protein
MKKLFLILLLAAACTTPDDPKTYNVSISVSDAFRESHNGIFWLSSDLVSDFNHVYDSIDLTATNKSSNLQQFFKTNKPQLSAQLTQGSYLLYMTSNRYINPKPIEKILQFNARRDSVAVTANTPTIILNEVYTQQALILVRKTGITGTPTIKVGNTSAAMHSSTTYWYAYIAGTSCEITTTVNGQALSRTITTAKANIYLLSIAGASIDIVEPFTKLIIV